MIILSYMQKETPWFKGLKKLFCEVAFPVVIAVTLSTDDNSILQSGGECLRAYLSVAPDQAHIEMMLYHVTIVAIGHGLLKKFWPFFWY